MAEAAVVVAEIAAAAGEQATGLLEVNTAVNQMDQVTQENAGHGGAKHGRLPLAGA